jgi:hypothetical protein
MVRRGIALSLLAIFAAIFAAAPALLGGCDASTSTFAVNEETIDSIVDQVVSLQVFPVRREYALEGDAIAKTEAHLRVFAVYSNGSTRQTLLRNTDVTLEEEEPVPLTEDEPHLFTTPGEKTVTVSYGARDAWYSIIVRSGDVPGLGPGSSSGGDTVIVFEPKWP